MQNHYAISANPYRHENSVRNCACLSFIILAMLCGLTAKGQETPTGLLYASSVEATSNSLISQGVKDAPYAVDADRTGNFATIVTPLLSVARTEYLRLGFPVTVPAGHSSGFVVGTTAAALDLDLLPTIAIVTYDSRNQAVEESVADSRLLAVSLFSGSTGPIEIEFTNSKPYSRIELRVTYPLGLDLGSDLRVYYAFASAPIAPLPVELMFFKGEASRKAVTLSWATASEENNSHFVVERSTGTAFDSVGTVKGTGSSSTRLTYSYSDKEIAGRGQGTYYYRLRQVDFDGTVEYSKVVALSWGGGLGQDKLSVYPNPASAGGEVTIELAGIPAQGQAVLVYDGEGGLVRRVRLSEGAATVPTDDLAPGLYLLVLPREKGRITKKLLVTR